MGRNHWRASKMPIRVTHVFLLAALAWLAPLTALHLHQKASPSAPSLLAHLPAFNAGGGCSQSRELPRLVEEEEESPTKSERLLVGPSSGATPIVSSSRSATPKAFLLPIELRLVSSAMPRGPPAFWL